MINLPDVTFCILFKPDFLARIENFKAVYHYLNTNFDTNINIVEVGLESIVNSLDIIIYENVVYNFYFDGSVELNLTKYKNIQTKRCRTKYLVMWDSDVIIPPLQVYSSVISLRSGISKVALPYNGKLIELNPILRKIYLNTQNLKLIENILLNRIPLYGNISVGAAVIFELDFYKKMGMDNENFVRWGHEDIERIKRAEIFGAMLHRTEGPAFHLFHPRIKKDILQNKSEQESSLKEFLKISSYSTEQLLNYIRTWDS